MSPNPGAGAFGARLFLGATLAAGTVLGGASAAFAAPPASPPGDNGTVKIHDPSTSEDDNRNEPKVCDFQIVADHFDTVQEVSWEILTKAENGGGWNDVVSEGTLVLDGEGSGATEVLELDDGHYKLDWTFEGQRSNDAKHKVFKVDCGDTPEEPEPTVPEESPEEEPSTPPTEEETPDGSPDPTDPAEPTAPEEAEDPAAPAEPTTPESTEPEADEGNAPADGEPSLPVTGSALTALVAAGAVAVAGGGAAVYFTRRRRNADAQE